MTALTSVCVVLLCLNCNQSALSFKIPIFYLLESCDRWDSLYFFRLLAEMQNYDYIFST
jgi:hypothetical protein